MARRPLQPSTIKRQARAAAKEAAARRPLKPEVVAEELEKVERLVNKALAEKSLYQFVLQAWHVIEPEKRFIPNWHIEAVCAHLQAVSEGKIENLLINIPPGTMKSLLVSVFWLCWEWTWRPTTKWLFASYDGALSMRDSVRCRNLFESPWYQARWPLQLRDDQNQKGLYENDRGGWRMATSVGGKATGHHPDRKIFDDPHNVKKAESEPERQAVIDWWDGTMASRGALSGATSVGVMQRLNHQDLSAHVLGKEEPWDHLCFPMRRELDHPHQCRSSLGFVDPRKDGELLWPLGYTEDKVRSLEGKMGIYFTAGQLQQRPSPRGGGMFKREWFTSILPTIPNDILKYVRYWDKAGTAGGDGARSSGTLMGMRRNGRPVIIEIIKGRWSSADREAVIKATAKSDARRFGFGVEVWIEQEPGSGGKESAENTVKNLSGFRCKIERVTGDKVVRAEPFAAQCAIQNVDLVEGVWNEEFIQEAEHFPSGKLKDQIDSTGGAYNKLAAGSGAFGQSGELTAPGGVSNVGDDVEFTRIDGAGDGFF